MATSGIKGIKAFTDWMGSAVIDIIEVENKKFLYNLWDEIVPNTPVRSGLAMFSWRMTPGSKSSYKPDNFGDNGEIINPITGAFEGYARIFPEPERPKLNYNRKYKHYFLFNNQHYVAGLNENENKYYYQFIEDGIARAKLKSKTDKKTVMAKRK